MLTWASESQARGRVIGDEDHLVLTHVRTFSTAEAHMSTIQQRFTGEGRRRGGPRNQGLSKGATGDSDERSGEGRKGKEPPIHPPKGPRRGRQAKSGARGGEGGEAAGNPGGVRTFLRLTSRRDCGRCPVMTGAEKTRGEDVKHAR